MYVFTHVPCSSSQREAHAYTQAALAMIYLTKQTQSSGLCYQLQSPARACAPGRTPRIGAATVQGAIDRCHRRGKKGQRERCSTLSPNITTGLLADRFIIDNMPPARTAIRGRRGVLAHLPHCLSSTALAEQMHINTTILIVVQRDRFASHSGA